MPSTIITKNGSGAPLAADLVAGELAVDLTNKRLYTEDSGGTVLELGTNPASDVTFGDNVKAVFGADSDLEIYSDGSISRLDSTSASLAIKAPQFVVQDATGAKNMVWVPQNGGAYEVQLSHDGSTKLTTTATGIDVTGTVTADKITTDNNVDAASFTSTGSTYVDLNNGTVTGRLQTISSDFFIGTATVGTSLAFKSGNNVEAMRIDSSGHVLINNTAFSSLGTLVVKQTADSKGIAIIDDTESNTFFIENNGDETKFRGNTTSPITFSHSTGEVMRIDSSGNLLVGQTTVSLTTAGVALLPTGELYVVRDSGATAYFNREGSDGDVIVIRNDNVTVGSISVSGSTTSYNPSSDVRLKENIRDYDNALADVMKLKPRKYSWKTDGAEDSGFIAQELMETPEFANRVNPIDDDSDDPMYGVDYMKFVAVLTGAIQEQQVMIEELKAEVAALKGA